MTAETFINRIISILYRHNQRFLAQRLARFGLPLEVGQIPALIQSYRYPGISQDGIAANTALDKGTVARAVKQLEDAGLIYREVDERDRRVNHIYPTAKALELEEQVFRLIRELHDILYQGFGPQEIEEASSLLERMKNNMAKFRLD